jgi:hypothetical protein
MAEPNIIDLPPAEWRRFTRFWIANDPSDKDLTVYWSRPMSRWLVMPLVPAPAVEPVAITLNRYYAESVGATQ